VVEILRVEIRWLGQCFEVGGALREPGHDAHGYVILGRDVDASSVDNKR
jgi:hypothetical protein